jgi:hypothetical protein
VSFHINVLVYSKNEIAIILLFAAITIWSVIMESVYYTTMLNVTVTDAAA